jgi:DNA modification methylase
MSKQTANVGKRRIEIAYVKLAELVPDPRNPRKMSDDQRARLRRGLEEFGLVDPFIVRRADKLVVGGHQRLKEAIALGFEEGPVVYLDQLNDQEAMALNILLNNPHAQGEFDMKMLSDSLSELDAEGMDATLTGFDEEQIQEIVTFEGSEGGGGRGSSDENFDPTPPEKPKAERGDLYVLGRHRLLCGDSMDAADVERLLDGHKTDAVFCDPPYAIYGSSTGVASDITDDKVIRPFFRDIMLMTARVLKPFGHAYICCDWRSWSSLWEVARGTGIVPKNMIVWDKGGGGLGSNYANAHELLFFASYVPLRQNMTQKLSGIRSVNASNIWRANRVGAAGTSKGREHNAQKPVEIVKMALENSTDNAERVVDFFGGAGTTMIAAEELGRSAYLMEVDPRYVDVTVRRWESATGQRAERVDSAVAGA